MFLYAAMTLPEIPETHLDVRHTKCPLNFVKTRLALEKLPVNALLEVWVDAQSQSVLNIPSSIEAEGHAVVRQEPLMDPPNTLCLWIRRLR